MLDSHHVERLVDLLHLEGVGGHQLVLHFELLRCLAAREGLGAGGGSLSIYHGLAVHLPDVFTTDRLPRPRVTQKHPVYLGYGRADLFVLLFLGNRGPVLLGDLALGPTQELAHLTPFQEGLISLFSAIHEDSFG